MWIFHNPSRINLDHESFYKRFGRIFMMYKMFLVKVLYWLFGKIASFQHSSGPWKFTFTSICSVLLGQYLGHTYMWIDQMIDEIIKLKKVENYGKSNSISITPHIVVVVKNSWQLVSTSYKCNVLLGTSKYFDSSTKY